MAEKIHRENWNFDKITSQNEPNWLCPTCGSGRLAFGENWYSRKPDAQSARESNRLYYNNYPEQGNYQFTGFLDCENIKCKEKIALVGYSGNLVSYRNGQRQIRRYFIPYFFYPSLHIFPLSENCPEKIRNQLFRSFSHFFNDRLASANALRTALEYLLNDLKIVNTVISKKGKTVELTLHARIEMFDKQYPELAPLINAAKWIGNAGSHIGEIDQDGLLDGFELLNHCIYELYEKDIMVKELITKAKEINDTKKPIKKK